MALRHKACAKHLSIAVVCIVLLAPAAQAQMSSTGDVTQTPAARASVLTYGVDAGVGESDNVTLVQTDKVSQTIATADVDFAVEEQTRLLDMNAKGDFSYFDYLQNAFSSQLIGRFDGVAKVAIVPDRLTWVVRDDFGQAAIDPYTAVTPNNLENINYVSTGPDLSMRLGGVNFINLSARYARAQYETSPYNSNRALGSVGVGRDVSAGASVSLDADFERVMFENTAVNSDFNRTSGFGRYELHGARTDFEADVGATTVSQAGTSTSTTQAGSPTQAGLLPTTTSQPASSTSGALVKVQLSRKLSAAATLTLTAGRELTDASSSFSTLQSGSIGYIGTAPAAQTSDSYTSNHVSVGWKYLRNRTSIAVSARWERDTYAGQPLLDVNRPGADFTIQRQLTRAFSAQLLGRFYKTDYPNALVASTTASSKYDDWLVGGALTWRHGRGLEIRLRYDHNSHVVSEGSSGYGENRVFLTIGYRPNPTTELQAPQ
jgi:hypothetical protein